jgi:hypothetical protein
MARQQIAEAGSAEDLTAEATQLCLAAQHASQRVTFQANEATKLPPVPVLIVDPSYYKQPTMRPYEFVD